MGLSMSVLFLIVGRQPAGPRSLLRNYDTLSPIVVALLHNNGKFQCWNKLVGNNENWGHCRNILLCNSNLRSHSCGNGLIWQWCKNDLRLPEHDVAQWSQITLLYVLHTLAWVENTLNAGFSVCPHDASQELLGRFWYLVWFGSFQLPRMNNTNVAAEKKELWSFFLKHDKAAPLGVGWQRLRGGVGGSPEKIRCGMVKLGMVRLGWLR